MPTQDIFCAIENIEFSIENSFYSKARIEISIVKKVEYLIMTVIYKSKL